LEEKSRINLLLGNDFVILTAEYALYERVKLYSVLAVPVKPRPCGFLAVRNPTRYVDAAFTDVLQLLAYVALVNINDIMQRRMRKLVRSPKDIRSANDIEGE